MPKEVTFDRDQSAWVSADATMKLQGRNKELSTALEYAYLKLHNMVVVNGDNSLGEAWETGEVKIKNALKGEHNDLEEHYGLPNAKGANNMRDLTAFEAIRLINDLVMAEVDVVNTQGGRGIIGATKKEHYAVIRLYSALTGGVPSKEQIEEMTGM